MLHKLQRSQQLILRGESGQAYNLVNEAETIKKELEVLEKENDKLLPKKENGEFANKTRSQITSML